MGLAGGVVIRLAGTALASSTLTTSELRSTTLLEPFLTVTVNSTEAPETSPGRFAETCLLSTPETRTSRPLCKRERPSSFTGFAVLCATGGTVWSTLPGVGVVGGALGPDEDPPDERDVPADDAAPEGWAEPAGPAVLDGAGAGVLGEEHAEASTASGTQTAATSHPGERDCRVTTSSP